MDTFQKNNKCLQLAYFTMFIMSVGEGSAKHPRLSTTIMGEIKIPMLRLHFLILSKQTFISIIHVEKTIGKKATYKHVQKEKVVV